MDHNFDREYELAVQELLDRVSFRMQDCSRETVSGPHVLLDTAAPTHCLLAIDGPPGRLVLDGLPYPLVPNAVSYVMPGQRVELDFDYGEARILYRMSFELTGAGADTTQIVNAMAAWQRFAVPANASALTYCGKIMDHWNTGDPAERFISHAGFQELLYICFRRKEQNEAALEKAFQYIKTNFGEAVTIEELAEKAGMSRYYFMRSFKERFGQSAMEFLTEQRTNEAKRLLEAGGTPGEVADAVGYKDPLYFSSQFKKQVGIPPRLYSLNRKCRTAAYSWPNIGHLLTLQMIPYAAPMDQTWSDDYFRRYRFDVKVPLSHDYDFNRLALERAKPDRIVALDEMIPEEEKEKLRSIAPILFLKWHEDDWRSHLRDTAGFLDREKEGERWLARYDEEAEAVRRNLPGSLRESRLAILSLSPKGIMLWGRRAGTVLYDDLRIGAARGVGEVKFTEYIEAGQLLTLEADALLVSVAKERQTQAGWERLRQSADWNSLKAVRSGNVYLAPGHAWLSEPYLEYTANRHRQLLNELKLVFRAL